MPANPFDATTPLNSDFVKGAADELRSLKNRLNNDTMLVKAYLQKNTALGEVPYVPYSTHPGSIAYVNHGTGAGYNYEITITNFCFDFVTGPAGAGLGGDGQYDFGNFSILAFTDSAAVAVGTFVGPTYGGVVPIIIPVFLASFNKATKTAIFLFDPNLLPGATGNTPDADNAQHSSTRISLVCSGRATNL